VQRLAAKLGGNLEMAIRMMAQARREGAT